MPFYIDKNFNSNLILKKYWLYCILEFNDKQYFKMSFDSFAKEESNTSFY